MNTKTSKKNWEIKHYENNEILNYKYINSTLKPQSIKYKILKKITQIL